MEKEKEKKGFWASLFAPKPCSCSVQFEEVTEEKTTGQSAPKDEKENESESDKTPKCSYSNND